jgi:hypothetical protein
MKYEITWVVQIDDETTSSRDAAKQAFGILEDAYLNPREGASILTTEDELGNRLSFDEWGKGACVQDRNV